MTSVDTIKRNLVRVSLNALETFTEDALRAKGASPEQARIVARMMAWSDSIGRNTHGTARLRIHIERFDKGVMKPASQPKFHQTSKSVARLDGDEGIGHYVSYLAMERAVALAYDNGIGVVGVHNSNFFGATANYISQAADAGMIGIALSNSVPNVAAFGGKNALFGTNPMGFGAPRRNGQHIMLDMATSAWSASAVRAAMDRGETLPSGVAIDEEGELITTPREVGAATLLPLGGAKGFGLAMMIEFLSAVITGAAVSKDVASLFGDFSRSGDNGHFMLALDPATLLPVDTYYERVEALIAAMKASNPNSEVLYPGEKRWRLRDQYLELGIPLSDALVAAHTKTATETGIVPPWER